MGIIAKNIVKEFGNPAQRILHDLDFDIKDGSFVSISGRSGSGKSTLLYILSTLDSPTIGNVTIDHLDPNKCTVKELHEFRNKNIGFIFQFHFLLPELTGLENVLLGPRNLNIIKEKKEYALHLLNEFGVLSEKDKLPSQMSGGQQQRVSIARALIMDPRYIFADEPTGNLDYFNGQRVLEILKNVNKKFGSTIVLVTHERDFASMADIEIHLLDGRVTDKNADLGVNPH